MARVYRISARVNSHKYGEGRLVARLNEADYRTYETLDDEEKLNFLKEHHAQFIKEIDDVDLSEVSDFSVRSGHHHHHDHMMKEAEEKETSTSDQKPKVIRKMRMNINGRDTGWLDVNEENEARYNEMLDQMNRWQRQFDRTFEHAFRDPWFALPPRHHHHLLDWDDDRDDEDE